jgi:hypothetical protein
MNTHYRNENAPKDPEHFIINTGNDFILTPLA